MSKPTSAQNKTKTCESVKISEHWTVKDGRAVSLSVAYFEPQALFGRR